MSTEICVVVRCDRCGVGLVTTTARKKKARESAAALGWDNAGIVDVCYRCSKPQGKPQDNTDNLSESVANALGKFLEEKCSKK